MSRYDAILCDGAVRSGKTLSMAVSFFAWAFSAFEEERFALCGKTAGSLRRNLLEPVLASVWGLLLFGERPGVLVMLGGTLILLGIGLYSREEA